MAGDDAVPQRHHEVLIAHKALAAADGVAKATRSALASSIKAHPRGVEQGGEVAGAVARIEVILDGALALAGDDEDVGYTRATISSATPWMTGAVPRGSISLGSARVSGSSLVPRPPAGTTALVICTCATLRRR